MGAPDDARGATSRQLRLLLASVLLLLAMLALGVAVARVPSAYAVLEGGRVEQAVRPRSWLAPLVVAGGCALAGLVLLVAALRGRADDRPTRRGPR